MSHTPAASCARDRLTAHFWSARGDVMRSRSVSEVVLTGVVDIPTLPARLVADWERELSSRPDFEPGDVDSLPLARARMRWSDYRQSVQAAAAWLHASGLRDLLADSDVALMACRGARYHHDGAQYGGAAFCNLFLSEDKGLDLHFPGARQRIPLMRGTVVVFDTGQPHAVVPRGRSDFGASDFSAERDCTQVFLTWELPIEEIAVARALRIDIDPATWLQPDDPQLRLNGARVDVHPESGRWNGADP